jgi:hypothetical protein
MKEILKEPDKCSKDIDIFRILIIG